jgi:hypothetical protein
MMLCTRKCSKAATSSPPKAALHAGREQALDTFLKFARPSEKLTEAQQPSD